MTFCPRQQALAAGLLLPLMVATAGACSSGSGLKTAPTTASTGPAVTGSTAPPRTGPVSSANAKPCQSTTRASGGTGGGDVLVPGDIPDTQHYVTYHSTDGYHIDYPEGWSQAQAGSAVTFTDKFNSIRVESSAAPGAPSLASAQQSDLATLAAATPCFQTPKISTVNRSAGSAVLITYRGDSPPDAVTGKVVLQDIERYQFWHSGRLVAITLSSPKGSDNVDPWRKVTDSFAWSA